MQKRKKPKKPKVRKILRKRDAQLCTTTVKPFYADIAGESIGDSDAWAELEGRRLDPGPR